MAEIKRVLLIDLDDPRRGTRVRMLNGAGYAVKVRNDWITSRDLDHEGHFDLLLIAISSENLKGAVAYGEQIHADKPTLPILLLTDTGVFAPRGTLNPSIDTGSPAELMLEIAAMLAGSTHIREVDSKSLSAAE